MKEKCSHVIWFVNKISSPMCIGVENNCSKVSPWKRVLICPTSSMVRLIPSYMRQSFCLLLSRSAIIVPLLSLLFFTRLKMSSSSSSLRFSKVPGRSLHSFLPWTTLSLPLASLFPTMVLTISSSSPEACILSINTFVLWTESVLV